MTGSLIVLGKIALFCGLGVGISGFFEFISDFEFKPKSKGVNKKKGGISDDKINDLGKRVRG
ncbi:hypothetical protein [Virgibacillus sp. DJP39]|uniref:hypothetical protein n=1 Tax=Virgibacillus sp. DJP39 TaxID=3409790 RepID=UPI003BB70B4C